MQRDIVFRGKRTDNSQWVEGFYFKTPLTEEATANSKASDGWFFLCGIERNCISRNNAVFQIDPSTIGQYTGLCDKNGKKIFEGDITQHKDIMDQTIISVIKFGEYEQDGSGGEYTPSDCLGFYAERIKSTAAEYLDDDDVYEPDYHAFRSVKEIGEFEIVGNIHDKPEMIGGAM